MDVVFPNWWLLLAPIWCWLCFTPCFGATVGYNCVVLAMIGPRITQGLFSLVKAVIVGFAACMQWLVYKLSGVD